MEIIILNDVEKWVNEIRDLFKEYLDWAVPIVNKEYGTAFSVQEMLAGDMATISKFFPPHGRLLLSLDTGGSTGILCLKHLTSNIGELKRMYVRPVFRGKGIGHALLQKAIQEARLMGLEKIKLDSARFMVDAHALYQSVGFVEIGPYEGSEIPKEFHHHWKFMEKTL